MQSNGNEFFVVKDVNGAGRDWTTHARRVSECRSSDSRRVDGLEKKLVKVSKRTRFVIEYLLNTFSLEGKASLRVSGSPWYGFLATTNYLRALTEL